MRQRYCIFLFLALLISCSDENNLSDNILAKESVLTVGVENVTDVGAVLKGKVSIQTASYDLAMGFQYSTSSGILPSNSIIIIATDVDAQYNFTAVVNNLNPETKYYFRAFVRNNEKEEYGETKEFTTSKSNYSAIDLGLSVKWGNCNLGAKTPEEAGGYYAWGEIETNSSYSWSNYQWCHGTYDSMSKYNTRNTYGGVDELVQLEQQDDAAHLFLGANGECQQMKIGLS